MPSDDLNLTEDAKLKLPTTAALTGALYPRVLE
jgi:hypothetical protein